MRRAAAALVTALACAGCTESGLRFPFSTLSGNAVHRFFPDLERRENAVRYGRWNALESSWIGGVNPDADRRLALDLRAAIRRLPGFPPDPRLAAPRLAREAPALFGALVESDRFERDVADALAASGSTPETAISRVEKALFRYRRSRFALEAPPPAGIDPRLGGFETARMLLEGDWLFAQAAEDLAASAWQDQRWKVRGSIETYDREIDSPPASIDVSWYRTFAPSFARDYAAAAELLDRATRFRIEIFEALSAADAGARRAAVDAVRKRYGLRG